MQKYLISTLSKEACQVLLFLMVSQGPILLAEFATTIMTEQEMKPALHELESLGLIRSIPQDDGFLLVALVDTECLNTAKAAPQAVLDEKNSLKLPLDLCREADATRDKAQQINALKRVWSDLFPADEYPNQGLTNVMADSYLAKRSATDVARIILDAVEHAKSRIVVPRAFIRRAIETARTENQPEIITEEVLDLARRIREQYLAKYKVQT